MTGENLHSSDVDSVVETPGDIADQADAPKAYPSGPRVIEAPELSDRRAELRQRNSFAGLGDTMMRGAMQQALF